MRIRRWTGRGMGSAVLDSVAKEEPLEIRVETRAVSVTMRTPGHDEELTAGFLVSEGLLSRREDLREIRAYPRNDDGNVMDVFLADGVACDFASLTRHVFASSSCGLCGTASIAAIRKKFPLVKDRFRIPAGLLASLPERLREGQTVFAQTGGLHAAGLFDSDGRLLVLREDVGRHNAVDKVIGRAFLDSRLPLCRSVLLVSGRVSFEIVQKALAAGIPFIAAVSAPTSLAVEFARKSGQTLVGFLRDGRFNAYSGLARIGATPPTGLIPFRP
jgi:FdhD protein